MKKVLITGANSYIGESFDEWLKQWPAEYQVDTIDMIGDKWRAKDFTGYDVVFHVAGIAHVKETKNNRDQYYRVNRDLAFAAAKKAKYEGVRQFIFLSSMSIYGFDRGVIKLDTQPEPKSHYGKSKYEAEKLINQLLDPKFAIAIIRPPMVYGPGCKGNYPKLARIAVKTPIFPKIKNDRSMIYIENLCQHIKQLIDAQSSGYSFPQNNEYVNTSDLVQAIAENHAKTIRLTRLFNPIIKILRVNAVQKVFGDLYYSRQMSLDSESYNICDFKSSIEKTESN